MTKNAIIFRTDIIIIILSTATTCRYKLLTKYRDTKKTALKHRGPLPLPISIMEYHRKKGELIPLDSEHYLYELANQKKLDESETLKMFPGGVAALGYGLLARAVAKPQPEPVMENS